MNYLEQEFEAQRKARELTDHEVKAKFMSLKPSMANKVSIKEMRRDVLMYAINDPIGFLDSIEDPNAELEVTIRSAIAEGILRFRNNKKEVYWNTERKSRLLTVPNGVKPVDAIKDHLLTDEGIEALKEIEALLGE